MLKETHTFMNAAKRRKARMQLMRNKGKSDQDIAELFGVSRQRIGQILGARK